jgi:hypothetical protein
VEEVGAAYLVLEFATAPYEIRALVSQAILLNPSAPERNEMRSAYVMHLHTVMEI